VKVKLHTIDKKKSFSFRGHRVKTQLFPHDDTGSLGYRLHTDGKTVVYITDTIADPESFELARNADLLLHECYFRNSMEERALETGHSYSSLVGRFAAAAKASRLALIHINPLDPEPEFCLREVMEHFQGAFLVIDNQEIDL
jgi:ribonuclease Z